MADPTQIPPTGPAAVGAPALGGQNFGAGGNSPFGPNLDPNTAALIAGYIQRLQGSAAPGGTQQGPFLNQTLWDPYRGQEAMNKSAVGGGMGYYPSGGNVHFMGGLPFPVPHAAQMANAYASLIGNTLASVNALAAKYKQSRGGDVVAPPPTQGGE